jgi:hypothetical protein
LSRGDINIYSLFVERGGRLIVADGIVGFVVPSGIASDFSASNYFRAMSTAGRIKTLLDFENRQPGYFPDVHRSFKFSVFVTGGRARRFARTECAFYLHHISEIAERAFELTPDDFARVNPNTGTAPVFRNHRDAKVTLEIYRRLPVLVRHGSTGETAVWPVRYVTMFHMTNDSGFFRARIELERDGFYPTAPNRFCKGNVEYLPLYEGKMVQMYNHRAASVRVNRRNLSRPAQPQPATVEELSRPEWLPAPQFWIDAAQIEWPRCSAYPDGLGWSIGFKEVTAPTNMRTVIAAVLPFAGFGNKLPIFVPNLPSPSEFESSTWEVLASDVFKNYIAGAPLLLANLNSFALDFLARTKVHGQTLNLFIVEQFPVVRPESFKATLGSRNVGEFVREEVLRLTYTASDMKSFAHYMGYDGPPFPWDEEDRRHRCARLDALFFRLYGIKAEDASYILDTFPIVEEQDRAQFGRYRTKELVLAYMNAIAAGDLETRVAA